MLSGSTHLHVYVISTWRDALAGLTFCATGTTSRFFFFPHLTIGDEVFSLQVSSKVSLPVVSRIGRGLRWRPLEHLRGFNRDSRGIYTLQCSTQTKHTLLHCLLFSMRVFFLYCVFWLACCLFYMYHPVRASMPLSSTLQFVK